MRLLLVRETGTLGARMTMVRRWPQQRSVTTVDVDGWTIRLKVADHRVKVEFDDAAAAAAALDVPVRLVIERALRLADEART